LTGRILTRRRHAVAEALDALRRQYPDYAVQLETRFLRQSTLRREMTRYQGLFEEGLISHEVYEDLKRGFVDARAAERRPEFDIGLDTHRLVKQLDILAGLGEEQIERICRLLRPRFAVPKERIIRRGDRGDAVYFIASGAVEVAFPEHRIRLESGDFFGEMALISGRRRQADVDAVTYCQLLVLRRSDFERFMRADPETRETIQQVAAAREALTTETAEGAAERAV
jgi:CPA1 family monovalent cation:H+ antiporter